jgi:sortase (surface protein transpeptidase)
MEREARDTRTQYSGRGYAGYPERLERDPRAARAEKRTEQRVDRAERVERTERTERRRESLRGIDRASLVVLCLAGLVIAGISGLRLDGNLKSARSVAQSSATTPPAQAPVSPAPPTATLGDQTPAVYPVAVSIPAIKVQATLQNLGLTSAGVLAPPTDTTQVGWYTGSAVPGEIGPAVLAGHIDSTTGPAVFYDLAELKPGDTITITLSDRTTVQFVVSAVTSYAKADFPTANVYGPVPDAELRVITCGGAFTDGHYLNNVIVYATLAGLSA